VVRGERRRVVWRGERLRRVEWGRVWEKGRSGNWEE